MIGYIYKLFCDNVNEFYIGSSFDMKKRKLNHKTTCNNPNSKYYNCKLYQYIRANGGFDNWKFEILEEGEFDNKTALKIKEQYYINLLKPTLNSISAYQTEEEYKLQRKKQNKIDNAKAFATKINCACGGKTSKTHKSHHEKTKKHQKYLQTINNINNITYNITNLHIHN